MDRQPLLDSLQAYALRHPAEAEIARRFIAFVASEPDCFRRELLHGHLTGSAWILNRSGDEVLLTHHRKLGIWVQPGGHCDGDPDVLATALREAFEESGLHPLTPVSSSIFDLDVHEIPQRGAEPAHLHWDVRFALRHDGPGHYQVSPESHNLAWVPLERLTDFSQDESLLRMARKWNEHPAKHHL
jgi:8-oxo-dGTP pyrophosphatase MutT (NUDIX family)